MPRRNEPTSRTCLVTRTVRPTAELLRFVLDPDGAVVPDLKHRLPGRGVWVTAEAAIVAEAEKRNLFPRAFKAPARVEPGLADRVAAQLRGAALGALSLARKAGCLALGFTKVEAAIADGDAVALIEAADAGEDGTAKLGKAAARRDGAPLTIIRLFSADDLGLALGRAHVIHAALLAGRAGDNALDQIETLARFLRAGPQHGALSQPLNEAAVPTAEHQSL